MPEEGNPNGVTFELLSKLKPLKSNDYTSIIDLTSAHQTLLSRDWSVLTTVPMNPRTHLIFHILTDIT